MKKLLSLLFAALILVLGLHLSIATHYCGGKVAAVKWSVTGKHASCGMADLQPSCTQSKKIKSNCCRDEMAIYTLDTNYSPSSFQIQKIVKSHILLFSNPVNSLFQSHLETGTLIAYVSPPDQLQANSVSLANICVFRI